MAQKPLTSKLGSLFIQVSPDEQPEYFGCVDVGDIAEPAGDQTMINCRNRDGDVEAIGSTQAPPGNTTVSITALLYPGSDILDRIKNCMVTLYAMTRSCGQAGMFANYTRGHIVHHARVTNRTLSNLIMREADEPSTRVLEFSGWNPIYKIRELTAARQSIAETTALNDIAVCSTESCGGDCGAPADADDDLVAVGDAPAGSPASLADVWQTDDEGATWINTTGGAGHPFAAAQDEKSVVCFDIDKDTKRWLVARGQVVAEPFKVAYSDNAGATWTLITVGATNNEGATGEGALFAFDRDHIWACTSAGNVYFSDDGGATWTAQASALTASGGNPLNAVQFSDYDNGYAVGDTDTLMWTVDGGENWNALTAPTSGHNLTTVVALSKYTVLVGSNAGEMYKSLDGGENWTSLTYTGQAATDTIKSMDFINELVGFMAVNTAAPVGSLHRSINGGMSWEKVDLDNIANAGLNAVKGVDENTFYAVGEPQGGTAVVIKVAG